MMLKIDLPKTYSMMNSSIGPGIAPLSIIFHSSIISTSQSGPNHSIKTYSIRCEARASSAAKSDNKNKNKNKSYSSVWRIFEQVREKITQEEEIRSRVTDELDEGFFEEGAFLRVRSQDVKHGMEWETNGDAQHLNYLGNHCFSTESR